jgi:hypothetical protein
MQDDGSADNLDSQDARSAAERRLAWVNSPEHRKNSRAYWAVAAFCLIAIGYNLIQAARAARVPFNSIHINWHIEWPYYAFSAFFFVAFFFISSLYHASYRKQFEDRMMVESQAQLTNAESRLAKTGELDLASLWAITQQRLDYYHNIATDQARQSFRNAQAAMAIGLLILATTITLSLAARSTVGSIVAGALGGIGAALAGYIGRTFIRAQESTAEHLRSYFDQPLEFSRFLAAERLLNTIDDEARASAAEQMIRAIVTSRSPYEAPESS